MNTQSFSEFFCGLGWDFFVWMLFSDGSFLEVFSKIFIVFQKNIVPAPALHKYAEARYLG